MELVLPMIERIDGRIDHLSSGDVARFVEKLVSPDERAIIEAHLNECDHCRSDVVTIARLVRRGRGQRRNLVAAPLVAAAAVALWFTWGGSPAPADPNAFRDGTEGLQRLIVVQPANDAAVRTDTLAFVWQSAGDGAQYVFKVTDAQGDSVLQLLVSDSSVAIERNELRGRGASFFWFVDAVLPDGSTATSGARRFSVPDREGERPR